jgi:hypothetical protein
MANSRIGESLWEDWNGNGYYSVLPMCTVFVTYGHVDIENNVVRRALASHIQRSGYVDSLGQAYALLDRSVFTQGYAGCVDEESDPTVCEDDGETFYGDIVDDILPTTWVEVLV